MHYRVFQMWDTNGALIQTVATQITVKTPNYPTGISSENQALQMNKKFGRMIRLYNPDSEVLKA